MLGCPVAQMLRRSRCLDLLEKEPKNREYLKFVPKFVDLLREAMKLRSRDIPDEKYYSEAQRIKTDMLKMIDAEARDTALRAEQLSIWARGLLSS